MNPTSRRGIRSHLAWGALGEVALGGIVLAGYAAASVLLSAAAAQGSTDVVASPSWRLVFPTAGLVTLALTLWTGRRIDPELAHWFGALSLCTVAYFFSSAFAVWLTTTGRGSALVLTGAVAVASAGWVCILALLQCAAEIVGRRLRQDTRRALLGFVLTAAGVAVVSGIVIPPPTVFESYPGYLSLLPQRILGLPAVQLAGMVVFGLWLVSLLVTPVVLWRDAHRLQGSRRQRVTRATFGSILPLLIVMICGALALAVDGLGFLPQNELDLLAIAFGLALPLTTLWLAMTCAGHAFAVRSLVTIVLWLFYGLAVVQLALLVGQLIDGDRLIVGVLVTVTLGATTGGAWRRLVGWILVHTDPRLSLAASVVAQDPEAARHSPGLVAERALRESLDDPGAVLLLALPDERWVPASGPTGAGPPFTGQTDTSAPGVPLLWADDGQVRALLRTRTPPTDTAGIISVLGPLLERACLLADIEDTAAQLVREQERATSAAEAERHRLERDLHDGVQGRLLALGLNLSLAEPQLTDPLAELVVSDTIGGIRRAIEELRVLASGALPSTLGRAGLQAAVTELVHGAPVPIEVTMPLTRLPADAESVAYFVICEAVTNALKHASPARITVSVTVHGAHQPALASIEIVDDGCGGADLRAGTGLRGLGERIHAVGGRFVVSDAVPHGTRLEAVIPCGS